MTAKAEYQLPIQ